MSITSQSTPDQPLQVEGGWRRISFPHKTKNDLLDSLQPARSEQCSRHSPSPFPTPSIFPQRSPVITVCLSNQRCGKEPSQSHWLVWWSDDGGSSWALQGREFWPVFWHEISDESSRGVAHITFHWLFDGGRGTAMKRKHQNPLISRCMTPILAQLRTLPCSTDWTLPCVMATSSDPPCLESAYMYDFGFGLCSFCSILEQNTSHNFQDCKDWLSTLFNSVIHS
jgi:hypothetical protein